MAILITQDRQVANLTPPEGKSRITVSVKSKVGSGLSVESVPGVKRRAGFTALTSTENRLK